MTTNQAQPLAKLLAGISVGQYEMGRLNQVLRNLLPWFLRRDKGCLHRSVKRVASAVGEGSIAIQLIHQHLSG